MCRREGGRKGGVGKGGEDGKDVWSQVRCVWQRRILKKACMNGEPAGMVGKILNWATEEGEGWERGGRGEGKGRGREGRGKEEEEECERGGV